MRLTVSILVLLIAAACAGDGGSGADSTETTGIERSPVGATSLWSVAGAQSGNRAVEGSVNLGAVATEVTLDSPARWIVAGFNGDASVLVVVSEDGSVSSIGFAGDDVETVVLGRRNPETPFLLAGSASEFWIVEAPVGSSGLTAPAVVDGAVISTTIDGTVTIESVGSGSVVVDVEALGDSRFAVDAQGRVAVLSEPTGSYPHGVVGDRLESASATVFDGSDGSILGIATAPGETVFETIAPMWADIDDDGTEELLLTASDARSGARLVAYRWDGALMSSSPAIGNGQRWRNLLGVSRFDSTTMIVDVQTPHIGGVVQWFTADGGAMTRVADISEFSTHRIGSRNLDQGLIIDGDGDGDQDVVVPNQRQDAISVLRFDGSNVLETRTVTLRAPLSSNLSAVATDDGGAIVAAGLVDGTVLIWR